MTQPLMHAYVDALAVLRALVRATDTIFENEDDDRGNCRYCRVASHPVDIDEDTLEADSWVIEHEDDCPSFILEHAFDGFDNEAIQLLLRQLREGATS